MVSWTAENDRKILLAIISQFQGKIDIKAVAEQIGDQCTERAVTERLKTLKRLARDAEDGSPSSPKKIKSPVKKRAEGSPTDQKKFQPAPKIEFNTTGEKTEDLSNPLDPSLLGFKVVDSIRITRQRNRKHIPRMNTLEGSDDSNGDRF